MKFDLFDTLKVLEDNFDYAAELTISPSKTDVSIRISVFKRTEWHHVRFDIPKNQINDDFVILMNIRLYRAIQEMKALIDNEVI